MKDRWEVYQRLMNGFFPEQPCYCIEILEWINVEDITDEWLLWKKSVHQKLAYLLSIFNPAPRQHLTWNLVDGGVIDECPTFPAV